MMRRRPLRRILAAAALLAIIFTAFPVTNVLAGDYSIDDSEFQDIASSMEQTTVYIWHKGKPPAAVSGNRYPVIISWDGKYYMLNASQVNYGWAYHAKYNAMYSDDDGEISDHHWGSYWRSYGYGAVSNLPLNFSTLKTYGTACSLSLPSNLPFMVATKGGAGNDTESYYAIGLTNNGKDQNESWLRGILSVWTYIGENVYGNDVQLYGSYDWLLDTRSYTQADWTADKSIGYYYTVYRDKGNTSKEYSSSMSLSQRTWRVYKETADQYSISTLGQTLDRVWRRSSGFLLRDNDTFEDALKYWKCYMSFYHANNGLLYSCGWTPKGQGDVDKSFGSFRITDDPVTGVHSYASANDLFEIYYCDPMPMSFIKSNYTVKNGQTTNLNGPVSINENVTITVEDGGVLSCTGWVVNNGRIVVKPGGTLIINEDEIGTDGVICTYQSKAGKYGGAVSCDGTIIIMPNCELCCGGIYGLQLGTGAQVVNYGSIITDSAKFQGTYQIENRAQSSGVYLGYDVIDGGFTLTAANPTVSGSSVAYPGQGTIQSTAAISRYTSSIYGKYASNVYVASASGSGGMRKVISQVRPDSEETTQYVTTVKIPDDK